MGADFYLDTARLGRMCPGARLAERDFGWLVGRLGSSLYLERFLTYGFSSLPERYRRRVSHLKCWRGIHCFQQDLAEFVGQPRECASHLFGQSSSMIRFAAECMFARANRVLVTDLAWPAYVDALKKVAAAHGKSVGIVSIRDAVFSDNVEASDVVEQIVEGFDCRNCDGLFLSDISYLGVRIPAEATLRRLGAQCRFSVVDGAQAINHRAVEISQLGCDLYVAGTQKWFCSYHPLRIAFVGRHNNAELIDAVAQDTGHHDSLFGFCRSLQGHSQSSYGETVNVSALIAAAGALQQMKRRAASRTKVWERLVANSARLNDWLDGSAVSPVIRSHSLRSGIVLARSSTKKHKLDRMTLARRGLVGSSFPDGLLRLSMPSAAFSFNHLSMISRALHNENANVHNAEM